MIFTDQLHTQIKLKEFPKRIISLVPSQSELLWDLGLREEIIGITKFCIHPKAMFKSVTRVGGTKTVNVKLIKELKPDLIIGNKEENDQGQIEALQKEFPVWLSDIYTLKDSLSMIEGIGDLVDKKREANLISTHITLSFEKLKQCDKTVLYLIWNNPFMVAGNSTFIGDMLNKMGLQNCITEKKSRYPQLTIEDIKELNPEILFLSTEPFPFNETHVTQLQQHLPNTTILLVDGELFTWYGSRLQKSVNYFNEILKLFITN